MLKLALWLKENGFRADQVQTFYPSPMATATAMYHSGLNPLKGLSRDPARAQKVDIVRGEKRRRLHKAFLRYHDAVNWPLLREALTEMGRADLIGNGKRHLIPSFQPAGVGSVAKDKPRSAAAGPASQVAPRRGTILTQHTGLPPRESGARRPQAVVPAPGKRRKSG
jgi:hypothetical protein